MYHPYQTRLDILAVEISEGREKSHLDLLGCRESGCMVEGYKSAVGHETVDEFQIIRVECKRLITLA